MDDALLRTITVLIGLLVYLLPLVARFFQERQPDEEESSNAEIEEQSPVRPRPSERRVYDPFEDPVRQPRPAPSTPQRSRQQPRAERSLTTAQPRAERPLPPTVQPRAERPLPPTVQPRAERPVLQRGTAREPHQPAELQEAAEHTAPGQLVVREGALHRPTQLDRTAALERRMRSTEEHAAAAERALRKRVSGAERAQSAPMAPAAPAAVRDPLSRSLLVEAVILNAALSRRRPRRDSRRT